MSNAKQLTDENAQLRRELATLLASNASLRSESETYKVKHQEALQANESLVQDAKEATTRIEELEKELSKTRDELSALLRRFYGRQSERFSDPDQMAFEFASEEQLADAIEGIKSAIDENENEVARVKKKRTAQRRTWNQRFPESLERREQIIDLPDEMKEGLERIGEDIVESAHFERPKVYINRKVYPKYIDPKERDRKILQAERLPSLIQGGRYDESFAAAVISNRLGYHLPIYRQEDMFSSVGIYLSRSSLLNIQASADRAALPLVNFMIDRLLTDSAIGGDDTSIRLLLPQDVPKIDPNDPKSARVAEIIAAAKEAGEKSIQTKMWAYRGVHVPINGFDFTISRHRDGPDLFLVDSDYEGTLLGDCYGANTGIQIRSTGKIQHAACAAHARRKVEAALDNHPTHAKHLLGMFRLLYDIEHEFRDATVDERTAARQERSATVWSAMREYLECKVVDVVSTDKMFEAKRYILRQFSALSVHLSDGNIPIDNNDCEQLMKQVALGRKNWMFLGSVASGYRTARLMTLVSSAIRNDLDVEAYLEDILVRLVGGDTDYESMLPHVWATAHPEHIRAHRQEQRQERNTRDDRARLARRLERLQVATS